MADMTTHLMLDDIYVAVEESHDAPAFAIAGYVNGRYANWAELVKHYAGTKKFLLSITVTDETALGAQCLDIENGDATIDQAPEWVKATAKAGRAAHDLRYYPKVYTSADNCHALIEKLTAAGIPRSGYMLWSAHYTMEAHICGPHSCGFPQADATQYTDRFAGVSLDGSMCYGYFFSGPPEPTPAPPPPPPVPVPVPVPVPTPPPPPVVPPPPHGGPPPHPVDPPPKPPEPKPEPKPVPPTREPQLGFNPLGHGNPAVKLLQKLLNEHRVTDHAPLLLEDGHFGFKTLEAVRDFQRRNGLAVDGIVGPHTWEKLGHYV